MNKYLNRKGFTLIRGSYSGKTGFTLIELLIVIAVLGTLAVVVLIALNPVQQLARTRDSGRQSTVQQLGRAMEARGTILGGTYPDTSTSWITDNLVDSGEINVVPGLVPYTVAGTSACATAGSVENGWCYEVNAANDTFIVYATAEADSNRSLCTTASETHFVYSSADGRGGIVCSANPNPGTQTFVN